MRVFIGIKASDKLQKQILEWQRGHKNLPVRFIAPHNLHITLVPPWYERNINQLVKHLKSFKSPFERLELSFSQILFAPDALPRLIWIEGYTPTELIKLRNNLVKHLGQRKEKRPFRSHITIARFKPDAFLLFHDKITKDRIDWSLAFSELTLFESKLSRVSANYFILDRIKLDNY